MCQWVHNNEKVVRLGEGRKRSEEACCSLLGVLLFLVCFVFFFPQPSLFGGFNLSTEINYRENEKSYILGQWWR